MEKAMGAKAVWVAGEIYAQLREFARRHALGWTFADGVQLRCYADDPDKVRKPDACFIRHGRLVPDEPPQGFITIAPDIVVEVVSPTRPGFDREIKARRYAANGVERLWLVDPLARTVECFHLVDGRYKLTASGRGDGPLLIADLPGLAIALDRLWLS